MPTPNKYSITLHLNSGFGVATATETYYGIFQRSIITDRRVFTRSNESGTYRHRRDGCGDNLFATRPHQRQGERAIGFDSKSDIERSTGLPCLFVSSQWNSSNDVDCTSDVSRSAWHVICGSMTKKLPRCTWRWCPSFNFDNPELLSFSPVQQAVSKTGCRVQ